MRYFRTDQTGATVFGLSDTQGVFHVDSYNGAIAQATANWPAEGILQISVSPDVANWLEAIAAPSQ